jgi:aryl-alcohol dehydrogenase-like predicted oxidoreductase
MGTMLFGESISTETACRLLDIAADAGINFFDSAEMYPVPRRAETQGRSEEILGQWLSTRDRSDAIIGTKVAGPGGMEWLRGGPVALRARDILEAIDGSLFRLRTDYIDLYQLHWPDR